MNERCLFNAGWRFYPEDIPQESPVHKGPAYSQAKTEDKLAGPYAVAYPDRPDDFGGEGRESTLKGWQTVELPHDYIISQPYEEKENNAWGFFRHHPAWYRKHFTLDPADEGKRLVLYFEGVADRCTVYLNGSFMLEHRESHTPFEIDITDFARFDRENVLAIRVSCGHGEGWWYGGGGIYRNVWLEKTERLAVERYGVFVAPEKRPDQPEDSWRVPVQVEVRNNAFTAATVAVHTELVAPDGRVAASADGTLAVPARETACLTLQAEVEAPQRWDIDTPNLYTAVTTVQEGDEVLHIEKTPFGFRTLGFDSERGFFLNGRPVKIQGVCGHGDCGLTGRAVPDSVYRYKARQIKRMGANAYRCSHYPQAEYWMDEMDRQGILVMAETRFFSSAADGLAELRTLIRRDRNHPSVFLWSVGNEEPLFVREQGLRILRTLRAEVRKLDTTRPVITANDRDPQNCTVYGESDLIGVNYNLPKLDILHEKYPDKAILSTENSATGTTRGWYADDVPALGRINAIDHGTNAWFPARELTWRFLLERPWVMGGFQWIAFEHRGEAAWPRVSSASGAIDLYLQPKDAFYQNQSFWLPEPMIHLLPHWNWPQRLGKPVDVRAYTNCEQAELFLNGRSLGRQTIQPAGHGAWIVPYEPGELRVVGYRAGEAVAADRRETTGRPVALRLRAENGEDVHANGRDVLLLTCTAVDAEGREVPDAAPQVLFYTNALGRVIATGADNTDHVPVQSSVRRMYAGAATVAVQLGTKGGALQVTAQAEGLEPFELELPITEE